MLSIHFHFATILAALRRIEGNVNDCDKDDVRQSNRIAFPYSNIDQLNPTGKHVIIFVVAISVIDKRASSVLIEIMRTGQIDLRHLK